jgi:uncharacterized protein YPO0396
MKNPRKLLCRVRLVNWHYFENETIGLNGSTLISGENTAGKSTILDAIQLVMTTNTRKFNTAANEKGKRDLKGYVRCKVGEVGQTYLRKNAVIANVALEFYEEKSQRYFVLGVHMTSPDEESEVKTRWYVEECRLEDLAFINGSRPALAEEFKRAGKKVTFVQQKNQARDRFKRRMGNLEDKFFDIIPKSLAFKPMDNVKDFINKFVLSEEKIDIEGLKTNIATLSELEAIIDKANREFYILEHLIRKTKIPFKSIYMDMETLIANKENWILLTVNDRKRLEKFQEKRLSEYEQVIEYMLINDCKLEQEGIVARLFHK